MRRANPIGSGGGAGIAQRAGSGAGGSGDMQSVTAAFDTPSAPTTTPLALTRRPPPVLATLPASSLAAPLAAPSSSSSSESTKKRWSSSLLAVSSSSLPAERWRYLRGPIADIERLAVILLRRAPARSESPGEAPRERITSVPEGCEDRWAARGGGDDARAASRRRRRRRRWGGPITRKRCAGRRLCGAAPPHARRDDLGMRAGEDGGRSSGKDGQAVLTGGRGQAHDRIHTPLAVHYAFGVCPGREGSGGGGRWEDDHHGQETGAAAVPMLGAAA